MTVDYRTRTDAGRLPVDVSRFLDEELPAAFGERPGAVAAASHPLRPLLIELPDRTWTFRAHDGRATVESGSHVEPDERHGHVRLTEQQAADLIADQVTPVGLMTAGELDQPAGRIGHLLDWWLVLRTAIDDDGALPPDQVEVPDDLGRSFTLGDDPSEMRGFLESAGFLHLRGVFTDDEMARIDADMDAARPHYSDGDGRSWWAGTADGERHLVRMQGFDRHSPAAAALLEDERFTRLGEIAGAGHTHMGLERNHIEALFKPIGITTGISDVPWHKDCSLGRHSYECCTLTVGISVTGAGPGSGQLRVIAGSHRARTWPSLLDVSELPLPEVPLATERGDVTIHLSCTLHMAEPPTIRERRVMYTTFRLPSLDTEAATEARHRLFRTARERAPLTSNQPS
jgi:hypothetical protein